MSFSLACDSLFPLADKLLSGVFILSIQTLLSDRWPSFPTRGEYAITALNRDTAFLQLAMESVSGFAEGAAGM